MRRLIAIIMTAVIAAMSLSIPCYAESKKTMPAPTVSVKEYEGYTKVTIKALSGASVYYTTDGSKPDKSSSKYSRALTFEKNTKLRFKIYKSGYKSKVFVYDVKVTPADTKTFKGAINVTKTKKGIKTGTELDSYVDKVLDKIIDADMSKYEKVQACYDWLVANVKYDKSYAYTLYMKNDLMGLASADDYCIVEFALYALKNKKGVCNDFAAALFVMLQRLGYDAMYCIGDVKSASGGYTPHAWVAIKCDNGDIYQFDAMLDASAAKKANKKNSSLYFARPDDDALYRNRKIVPFGQFTHR